MAGGKRGLQLTGNLLSRPHGDAKQEAVLRRQITEAGGGVRCERKIEASMINNAVYCFPLHTAAIIKLDA